MQGKGISLRLGLLALVVVLVLSAVGSLSLARDAFDGNDYEDCPAATRLDAVSGLAVDRTDKEDEIRISWDALSSTVLDKLGVNLIEAGFTVIVEGGVEDLKDGGPLGTTSLVVKGIEYTKDLTVSVAITLEEFVISDIAEKDFTSGMPAPSFYTGVKVAGTDDQDAADGSVDTSGWAADEDIIQKFYYLGFNDVFDNWFVESHTVASPGTLRTSPRTAKFRVGLRHGDGDATPAAADFDHYRIVIEDSSGDLLGYQARTVRAGSTYGSNKIVFGDGTDFLGVSDFTTAATDAEPLEYRGITNIRLAGDVTGDSAMSPYYAADYRSPAIAPDGSLRLSYGNVDVNALQTVAADGVVNAFFAGGVLFVDPPVEYFDFPSDVFEGDGNYTIKAWAEDEDRTRISPVASIVLSVREGDSVESTFTGYVVTPGVGDDPDTVDQVRSWGDADVATLSVYGLSIQVED